MICILGGKHAENQKKNGPGGYRELLCLNFARFMQLPKNRKAAVGKVFWMPELILIFSLSVYCIYRGMNDPFLYFRF